MRKEYFETPKLIRTENAAGGKKRIWVEVAEGEAVMLKLDGNAKQSDIDAEAGKALARLKEAQAKQEELEALRHQVAELEQQPGL
jgi:hypothetical protein